MSMLHRIFRRPDYQSDVTQFIEQLKAEKPDLEASSVPAAPCCGTSTSTARPGAEWRGAEVAQKPYVYQTERAMIPTAGEGDAADEPPAPPTCPACRDVVDQVALARLYGEPLFAMPTDLYIPPDALEVFLEAFEGPLDLLLYLIRKQNFNILDIPMAERDTPVPGVRRADPHAQPGTGSRIPADGRDADRDQVAHAAAAEEEAEGEEPEDPRAELVRRLLEYEQMKLAAARLNALPQIGRDFLRAQVSSSSRCSRAFPT